MFDFVCFVGGSYGSWLQCRSSGPMCRNLYSFAVGMPAQLRGQATGRAWATNGVRPIAGGTLTPS